MNQIADRILYEDNHLIIINKKAGELVQGDKSGDRTLADDVKEYLKVKYSKPGNVYLGIPHRLDRPTTGIVVYAKTEKALVRLTALFRTSDVKKTYWAVVDRLPEKKEGELVHYIVRGGWPGNLDTDDCSIIPKDYVERVYTSELDKLEIPRIDRMRFRRLMLSLARNESTVCSISSLASDASINGRKLDEETVGTYLDICNDLFLLNDQEAFSPEFRSRTRLKIGKKRHFADPSIAAAIIGANEKNLINDLKYLGFLFESLAFHDLRIYMETLGGNVFHYQDYDNDEVDAVAVLDDGRFGLIEIKLGWENVADSAAQNLLRVAGKFERKPSFLAIVSGTAIAPLQRKDGVYIIPLTSLKP